MREALGHPEWGYYATRDPLGRAGDFITAPEISQVFGELIGLWCASVWASMGSPDRAALIEQYALNAGVNAIAYPSTDTIVLAKEMELDTYFSDQCCALFSE